MARLHVKKGDNVLVIAGKDKGKIGKVLLVNPSESTVIVEGVNIISKHQRARTAQEKGGIVKKEGKIHSSNVQVIDPTTKRPTRISYKIIDGKKVRVSKHSDTVLDQNVSIKKSAKKAADKKSETKVEKATTAKKETAAKKTTTAAKKATTAKKAPAKTAEKATEAKSTTKTTKTAPAKATTAKTTATKKTAEKADAKATTAKKAPAKTATSKKVAEVKDQENK